MSMPEDGMRSLNWRKAKRSISNGACVEVVATTKTVAIRDSRDPYGGTLQYSFNSWRSFIADARIGRFDGPNL